MVKNIEKVPYGAPIKRYIGLSILLFLSMYFSAFMEALDIQRYYSTAESHAIQFNSLSSYIPYLIETNYDFIYFTSLYLALKLGISLNIVTTIYLSIYYISVCEVIRRLSLGIRISKWVLTFTLLCAPFIWVQEISRNLAAISFAYLAVLCYISGNRSKGIFWLVMACCTHISMLIYLPVFIAPVFLQDKQIKQKTVMFVVLTCIVISYMTPSYLFDLFLQGVEGSSSRYSSYELTESQNALMTSTIGYGDKLPMIWALIYSIICLLLSKTKDYFYWGLLILVVYLSSFIQSSVMFTNRVIMLLPLFVSVVVVNIYKYESPAKIKIIKYCSFIGLLFVAAHFWAYRMAFNFF